MSCDKGVVGRRYEPVPILRSDLGAAERKLRKPRIAADKFRSLVRGQKFSPDIGSRSETVGCGQEAGSKIWSAADVSI